MPLPPDILTTTIDELPPYTQYGPVAFSDKFALWLSAFAKTVWVDVATLKTLIETGGNLSTTPVVIGDKYIHDVTEAEAGGTIVSLPFLAGQNFFLQMDGRALKTDEYVILNAGGFQITIPDFILTEGQRFTLSLYSFQAGGGQGVNKTASLFKGELVVSGNKTLTADDINKLIQLRTGSTQSILTLTDIDGTPDNAIVVIEATIGNSVQNAVTTQGGQYIYMNNTSYTTIYVAPGEVVWLHRKDDGWYVINDFNKNYLELAKPQAAYEVGLNELLCDGSLITRAAYPRLYEKVQTLGFAVVDESIYGDDYRGCFTYGDGSTTFRLPNLTNMALRGITSGDSTRPYNHPGGYQKDTVKVADNVKGVKITGTGTVTGWDNNNPGGKEYDLHESFEISTGTETTMKNAGVLWVIKA